MCGSYAIWYQPIPSIRTIGRAQGIKSVEENERSNKAIAVLNVFTSSIFICVILLSFGFMYLLPH